MPPDVLSTEFSPTVVRIKNKPQEVFHNPESSVRSESLELSPHRPGTRPEKRHVKAEQYKCECPDVVTRQWPAAEEPVQQRVAFNAPRRKLFGPAMRSLDFNLELGEDEGCNQYEDREGEKISQYLS